MALSLDSIHQPLNDFFLNRFKFDVKSPVVFRFDKFGSVISDQNFIDPKNPEVYSSNLAMEMFSDLVNRIPIEDDDGLNIFVSQAEIDQAYVGLLNGSVPFIPEGSDAQTTESIITSFSVIKNEALKRWANIKLESSSGLMFEFKPSLASPKDWYDKKNKDNWTTHSLNVTETAHPGAAKSLVWVKKIDDTQMAKIVPLTDSAKPVKPAQLAATLLRAHPYRPVMTTPRSVSARLRTAGGSPRASARVGATPQNPKKVVRDHRVKKGTPTTVGFGAQTRYLRQVQRMKLEERIAVSQYIVKNAPTQPATTNSISISFDYCLVNISRPWYRPEFINNPSWYIPNTTKGQLTAHVSSGANLTLMPIGVVAIKNLNIQAHWSDADIANSKTATNFGPFKVDGIANNSLSHAGIQIIGWLFERMPDLPPNGFPDSTHG